MKKILKSPLPGALLLTAALAALIYWGVPAFSPALPEVPSSDAGFGGQTLRARVEAVIDEGMVDLGGRMQEYQVLQVELLEGEYQGILMEVDYGLRQLRPEGIRFSPGDQILVTFGRRPDGVLTAYFVDFVRTRPLLWLLGTFVAFILLVSRWKGFRSLLALAFSLTVIIAYIIPNILSGEDPVRVSITGSALLLGVTLYLTYGWNLKTHSAVVGTLVVLLITGSLAWFFVGLTRLTGQGNEEALFLLQMPDLNINLRGLVLGGMLIGALGVLDDLVTTQASAIFELHTANPRLGFGELYRRVMRIGQDHVAATVNTLVLAYAGASLPMLLLFTMARGDYGYLVNLEFVAEEIVRTLVGSIGLLTAVPITTAISAAFALYHHRLGPWRRFLGPENSGESHGHAH
jgi:uncharacterized membrane protein